MKQSEQVENNNYEWKFVALSCAKNTQEDLCENKTTGSNLKCHIFVLFEDLLGPALHWEEFYWCVIECVLFSLMIVSKSKECISA